MPNRILKESICTSDSIESLKPFEETFFYRLIVNCDDYGRFDARIKILKNKLFPLKDGITNKNVEDALRRLASLGLVVLYESDGKPFLFLPTWENHQQVRAKRSKYPVPDIYGYHVISDAPVIQSESESESESESNITPSGGSEPVKKATLAEDFERLWKLYPKKQGKDRAFNDFKKALKDGFTVEEIEKGINDYCFYIKQKGVEQQFVKHGSTWFHGKHWLDDYTIVNDNRSKKRVFNNFEGRKIDYAELERQEQEYIKNMLDKSAGKAVSQ